MIADFTSVGIWSIFLLIVVGQEVMFVYTMAKPLKDKLCTKTASIRANSVSSPSLGHSRLSNSPKNQLQTVEIKAPIGEMQIEDNHKGWRSTIDDFFEGKRNTPGGCSNLSTSSLERSALFLDDSSYVDYTGEVNCSIVSSSSSCEEDPETYLRMDAMDDTSGTSSEEADDSRDDSSEVYVRGQRHHASPVFVRPIAVPKLPTVLATSTPRKVFYPTNISPCRNKYISSDDISAEDLSKIKRLAASMPTSEELEKLEPMIRTGPRLGDDEGLVIPRSGADANYSPVFWPSPVSRASPRTTVCSKTTRLGVNPNSPPVWPSPVSRASPRTMTRSPTTRLEMDRFATPVNRASSEATTLSKSPRPDEWSCGDLSPHLVRDIGLRRFNLLGLPAYSSSPPASTIAKNSTSPPSKRRLDKVFREPPNSVSSFSQRHTETNDSVNNEPSSRPKTVKFRSETEEAVYYLQTKYLADPLI